MAQAWVACSQCRTLVVFGKEHWRKNRPYCETCYRRALNATDGSVVKGTGRVQDGLDGEVADQGLRRLPVEKAKEGTTVSGGISARDDRTEDTVSQGSPEEPATGLQEVEGSSQGTVARRLRRPKGRTWW